MDGNVLFPICEVMELRHSSAVLIAKHYAPRPRPRPLGPPRPPRPPRPGPVWLAFPCCLWRCLRASSSASLTLSTKASATRQYLTWIYSQNVLDGELLMHLRSFLEYNTLVVSRIARQSAEECQ